MQKAMLSSLCAGQARVWVYLAGPELCRLFLAQAEREGFRFADGARPTARACGTVMALNPDQTLNYVGYAGHAAFGAGAREVGGRPLLRVDYRRLLDGEADITYRAQ